MPTIERSNEAHELQLSVDVVLRLRELRKLRGLTQKALAAQTSLGEKTISSFETGQRIGSLKISQLLRILDVYGMTTVEFFGARTEREISEVREAHHYDELRDLIKGVADRLRAVLTLIDSAV
jgi:transcriptional regulator with XRE-family HTH domain